MTNLRTIHTGIDSLARIGKAIDHPLRIRALAAVASREMCVCELVELFALAPSTVSKHMSILADAGLVARRRDSRWTYYSVPSDPDAPVQLVLDLVATVASGDEQIAADQAQLPGLTCSRGGTDG